MKFSLKNFKLKIPKININLKSLKFNLPKFEFKDKHHIFFLDKECQKLPEKFDVILSPSFYWMKKEKLNIPLYKAKKLAPSLFDGELPEGKYDYFVFKQDDEYVFIAFSKKEILDFLKSKNVSRFAVNKIYFAQKEFYDKGIIKISNNRCLSNIDKIVTIMPFCPQKATPIEDILKNIKLSNNFTYLYEVKLKNSEIYSILGVLVLFGIIYSSSILYYKLKLKKVENEIYQIQQQNNLPSTMFQLNSILASYKRIDTQQISLREKLHKLTMLKLKDEYFLYLKYEKNKFYFAIKTSKDRVKYFKYKLNKIFSNIDYDFSNNTLKVTAQ